MGQQGLELRRRPRRARSSLKDFRKDIIIDLYNEAGQLASPTRSTAAGCPSTRRCPISTPTPTRSRSSHQARERGLGARLRGPEPAGDVVPETPVRHLSPADLLDVWERGHRHQRARRPLALLAHAEPDCPIGEPCADAAGRPRRRSAGAARGPFGGRVAAAGIAGVRRELSWVDVRGARVKPVRSAPVGSGSGYDPVADHG